MILRSVMSHVRNQQWAAIVLDFIIVVVGVFIGIQVSNWNEAQADKRLGVEYVQRLSADIHTDLARNRGYVAYYSAVLEAVEYTNELLSDPNADPEALVVSAYRATEVNFGKMIRATWDQIISSGHLGLLPNAVIDSGLADYFGGNLAKQVSEEIRTSSYRRTVRGIIPIDVQQAIRAGCSDVRDDALNIVGFMQDCNLAVETADLRKIADDLRNDPAVIVNLRNQYSAVTSATLNLGGSVLVLERAFESLEAELANAKGVPE